MNELIKYSDLNQELNKYIDHTVFHGSNADKINNWLCLIYFYGVDKSKFYNSSDERDSGWYIDKESVLNMLLNTIPKTNDKVFEHDIKLIANKLQDFIIDYKEPRKKDK